MRWKLIAGNVVALLLVGVIAWVVVRGQVADALARDVDPRVQRSVGLFEAVRTAEGEQYRSVVIDGAQRADLRQVFARGTVTEQASAAFEFAQRYARELGTRYPTRGPREADLVAVATAEGRVLARNIDANQDRNRDLRTEYEVVQYALQGQGHVARDFLKYDQQKWYDVAIAPVVIDNQLRGLLLVGYEIGDSIAAEDKRRLGAEVGYLIREGNQFALHSLSFGTQAEKDALLRWANSPEAGLATLFNTDGASPLLDVTIGSDTYRLSARAMPGVHHPTRAGQSRPGFLVLENRTDIRAPATSATTPILWLLLVGLALVTVYNIGVANYLLQPIEAIEEGLLRIINGDRDHRIEIQHVELGGIVYRINQLVSELTGAEEETDESGRISHPPVRPAAPNPAVPVIDEAALGSFNAAGNPADAQLAQSLSAEAENEYYERLRREYLLARQRAGLGGDGLTHEQFVASVSASEQMLAQKYALTLVRFQVQAMGNQVIFRPVPIR
jgi:methyl-accepting chemotaxis protein